MRQVLKRAPVRGSKKVVASTSRRFNISQPFIYSSLQRPLNGFAALLKHSPRR